MFSLFLVGSRGTVPSFQIQRRSYSDKPPLYSTGNLAINFQKETDVIARKNISAFVLSANNIFSGGYVIGKAISARSLEAEKCITLSRSRIDRIETRGNFKGDKLLTSSVDVKGSVYLSNADILKYLSCEKSLNIYKSRVLHARGNTLGLISDSTIKNLCGFSTGTLTISNSHIETLFFTAQKDFSDTFSHAYQKFNPCSYPPLVRLVNSSLVHIIFDGLSGIIHLDRQSKVLKVTNGKIEHSLD